MTAMTVGRMTFRDLDDEDALRRTGGREFAEVALVQGLVLADREVIRRIEDARGAVFVKGHEDRSARLSLALRVIYDGGGVRTRVVTGTLDEARRTLRTMVHDQDYPGVMRAEIEDTGEGGRIEVVGANAWGVVASESWRETVDQAREG